MSDEKLGVGHFNEEGKWEELPKPENEVRSGGTVIHPDVLSMDAAGKLKEYHGEPVVFGHKPYRPQNQEYSVGDLLVYNGHSFEKVEKDKDPSVKVDSRVGKVEVVGKFELEVKRDTDGLTYLLISSAKE